MRLSWTSPHPIPHPLPTTTVWWYSDFSKVDRDLHPPWLAMCHWRRKPFKEWSNNHTSIAVNKPQTVKPAVKNKPGNILYCRGIKSSTKERELNAYSLAISVDNIQKVLVLAPSYQGILGRETSAICTDGWLQCSIYLSHCASVCQTEMLVFVLVIQSGCFDSDLEHLLKAIMALVRVKTSRFEMAFPWAHNTTVLRVNQRLRNPIFKWCEDKVFSRIMMTVCFLEENVHLVYRATLLSKQCHQLLKTHICTTRLAATWPPWNTAHS